MIGASGEGIETERAEQQREHEGVARILVEMLLRAGQRRFRLAFDRCGHDLDMPPFARTCRGRQLPGPRCAGAGLRDLHVHLVDAGACNLRERKIGIVGDGAIEGVAGAVPG